MKSIKAKNKLMGESKAVDSDLLINKAKGVVSKNLLGGAVFVLVGLMLFNTVRMTNAGNSNTSNLNLNVTAGVLEILNADANVQFAATAQGTAANVTQNLNSTTISDWRSTSNWFWDLNMYSQPLTGQTDSNYLVPNTLISAKSNGTTKTNVNAFDTAKLGNGVGERALNGDNVYFNAEDTSGGVVQIDDVLIKANLNASLIGQTYRGNLTLTVVAS
jgi:hypothetical protein